MMNFTARTESFTVVLG